MYQEITLQLVTNCNLDCIYCFAPKHDKNEITLANFEKFFDFCKENKPDCIHITGGEPTLHPFFCEIVNHLSEIATLVIYSNLTVKGCIEGLKLKNADNIVFLANLNERKSYNIVKWDIFEDNVDQILRNGFRIAIGHTFFRESFGEEFDEIIEYLLKHKIDHFRISQALISYSNKIGLGREQINNLYTYVADSIDKWREWGIKAYFDCPVPPCYMKQNVFEKLRQHDAVGIMCMPKAFVMWDLEVTHCYSTIGKGEKKYLWEFETINEIKENSKKLLRIMRRDREKEFCKKCVYEDYFCGCPNYEITGKAGK